MPTAKSSPSRQPEKRPPMLTIICGETAVGKTHRNRSEVYYYLRNNLTTGKQGRKVLAFDTNDDDYTGFKTVSPKHLNRLKATQARRIRPFNPDGSPMGREDKRKVVNQILKYFKDGLILLDDIDDYMTGERGQDMIAALCTLRHKGVDIIFTHQSLSKITRTAFENCTWLRLHHQVDDVNRIKDRIPKYPIVRIAQLIVDDQYELAYERYQAGTIDSTTFRNRNSYFVYVNLRKQRIRGCSRATYIRACKKFIDQEENRVLKMMMNERDLNNQPIYKNRTEALVKRIEYYLRFHEKVVSNPYASAA